MLEKVNPFARTGNGINAAKHRFDTLRSREPLITAHTGSSTHPDRAPICPLALCHKALVTLAAYNHRSIHYR